MKKCQYCETWNNDENTVCSGCGASEFFHACVNCGTLFEGTNCPSCGVKVGTDASVCPSCKRRYYTASCPHCGYSPAQERERSYRATLAQNEAGGRQTGAVIKNGPEGAYQAPKKRHTFLWILGWLFIFPLPLTVLLLRKKSGFIGKVFKTIILIFAWLFYLVAVFGANEEKNNASQLNNKTSAVYFVSAVDNGTV